MWFRRLLGNISLPWLLGAVVLCVAAFVVGVMTSGSSDGPVTAEERPTPQAANPPTPTSRVPTPAPSVPTGPTRTPLPPVNFTPPLPTAEELRRIEESGSYTIVTTVGKTTAGTTIKFSGGRTLKLPSDVYVANRWDRAYCAVGEPCPKTPIYYLHRGGAEIVLDGDGKLIPDLNEGIDLAQFSFVNNIKDGP